MVTDVHSRPTLFLTVGLPGVGKTMRAKELAWAHRILRLTPDEWMAPLFGQSDADGRRDILEGRMIWVAHEVLASGSGVILDFGCWSAEERYAIRVIAETAGAHFALEYVHSSEAERRGEALFFGNGSVCFQHRGGFMEVLHQQVTPGWYALAPRFRNAR